MGEFGKGPDAKRKTKTGEEGEEQKEQGRKVCGWSGGEESRPYVW